MIAFEHTKIYGWEPAIRGMRNPMNSWKRSDTKFSHDGSLMNGLGAEDYKLMKKLADAGQVHGKYLRMITVTADIIAPRYWWTEYDTYKVGTVANSCSTMFKIAEREFCLGDFSYEKLAMRDHEMKIIELIIAYLNVLRKEFSEETDPTRKKLYWYQMIQLLPQSYNQRRTVQLNYAVLKNIYENRKEHKLDEWRDFCAWIKKLPYSELITGE